MLLFIGSIVYAQDNWKYIGPDSVTIYSFGLDQKNLFAGGLGNEGGMYLSTDNGDHWTLMNTGLPLDATPFRAIVAGDTSILASASLRGMYLSTDIGQNWKKLVLTGSGIAVNSIVIAGDPWNKTLVAGSKTKGLPAVAISEDGIYWPLVDVGLPPSFAIFSMIVVDSNAYVGTYSGVYRLHINSDQWVPSNTGMTTSYVRSLGFNGSEFYAGSSQNGIFKSTDGENWLPANPELPIINTTTFTAFAFYGQHIFAAASGEFHGVYQSSGSINQWMKVSEGLPDADINALTISGPYLFAGTTDNGVYRISLSELTSLERPVKEDEGSINLTVYPNPSEGKFNLSFSSEITFLQSVDILCTTQLGRTVFNKTFLLNRGNLETELDFSMLPNGLYVLHVGNRDKSIFKKIIIIN